MILWTVGGARAPQATCVLACVLTSACVPILRREKRPDPPVVKIDIDINVHVNEPPDAPQAPVATVPPAPAVPPPVPVPAAPDGR